MNTKKKCEAILMKIVNLANEGKTISFEEDMGENTLTIKVDNSHTHCGVPGKDGSFELLINNLYNSLHDGPGLSWYTEKMYVQVEYDTAYISGDEYNQVGAFAYVPLDLINELGVPKAFEKHTGISAIHIVHYNPDVLYDENGELLDV